MNNAKADQDRTMMNTWFFDLEVLQKNQQMSR